uniref:PH domain and leucine rich repeat protein phosphatase 1 n=1 Tax=Macrostomum lignano TaxID=282301 RepID=A0A1I8FM94_9PLAT
TPCATCSNNGESSRNACSTYEGSERSYLDANGECQPSPANLKELNLTSNSVVRNSSMLSCPPGTETASGRQPGRTAGQLKLDSQSVTVPGKVTRLTSNCGWQHPLNLPHLHWSPARSPGNAPGTSASSRLKSFRPASSLVGRPGSRQAEEASFWPCCASQAARHSGSESTGHCRLPEPGTGLLDSPRLPGGPSRSAVKTAALCNHPAVLCCPYRRATPAATIRSPSAADEHSVPLQILTYVCGREPSTCWLSDRNGTYCGLSSAVLFVLPPINLASFGHSGQLSRSRIIGAGGDGGGCKDNS